jgi:CRISPR-associated endonuclease Cas2
MFKPYLICYDVADQKRLSKLARYLYMRSSGGQKSALNIHISGEEFSHVIDRIKTITAPQDLVNIISVNSSVIRYGKKPEISYDRGAIII